MPRTRSQRVSTFSQAPTLETKTEEEESDDEDEDEMGYIFDGKSYKTYSDMVDAKRARNHRVLMESGLLQASATFRDTRMDSNKKTQATHRGLATRKKRTSENVARQGPVRKSSRLAGAPSDGVYVEDERSGRFTVGGVSSSTGGPELATDIQERFFNSRINDGSDLTIQQAMEMADDKWIKDQSISAAEKFVSGILPSFVSTSSAACASPKYVISPVKGQDFERQIETIRLDDEAAVAKVTPDRIYAMACHPTPHAVLACAGDKQGYVGLWNVDQTNTDNSSDGVHLFRPHSRPVSHLEWNRSGSSLVSASYDGSVRQLDLETQTFSQIFATYDDSEIFEGKLGFGLHQGSRYWIQYACLDHSNSADEKCLFLSSSAGTVMHVDLRSKGHLTFNKLLSEKKINSVR
jgi:WD40 repeat protein